jgi:hypothetical protein
MASETTKGAKDRECTIVGKDGNIEVLNKCGSDVITLTQNNTEIAIEGDEEIRKLRTFILEVCNAMAIK